MMDIEKLIERMREAGWTNPGMINKQSLEWDAATAISALVRTLLEVRQDAEDTL